MSQSNMLRAFGLAAALAASGCFAQGSNAGDLGTSEVDVVGAEITDTAEPGKESGPKAAGPTAARAGGPEAIPACDSCGYPIPWTPPHDSLKPHLTPPDPSEADNSK